MNGKLVKAAQDVMRDNPGVEIVIGNTPVKIKTGKISYKNYKCTECGYESKHQTNHYGEIYPGCPKCARPGPKRHVCLDPIPAGWDVPTPWKLVSLRDICTIK
jgi:hypothetical protein